MMEQRLWVADNAVAYVDSGAVTIQIDRPTRHLPRSLAFEVADKVWFAGQMRELEIARRRGETKVIPLTDRRRRSSVRLGGGFMITQGERLVVIRRGWDGPRPGQFCECGGVFEFVVQDPQVDPEDVRNDWVASLLKESQEIVLVRGDTLYIPQLAPSPPVQIGFQPPGTLSAYNTIIEQEVKDQVRAASIPVTSQNIKHFWMKILDYEQSVRLQFGYSPELSVEITGEVDGSSLECVGVLSLPDDIDAAVLAFLEAELASLKAELAKEPGNKQATEAKIIQIQQDIREVQVQRGKDEIRYWDAELRKDGHPADREIHIINIQNGEDIVWFKAKGERLRESRRSTLWTELSATRLGPLERMGTGGRFATEKLEKAIKMHCPLPHLQPLVRL